MIRHAILIVLLLPAAADEVILADGSSLNGTVTALADGGQVMLSSPLSFEPFQLRAESIKRVDFALAGKSADAQDALVVLSNGDQFPADLAAIDLDSVTVRTAFAGEIRIPRSSVSTIQLGVRPRKLIYRGPEDDAGWTIKNGWTLDSGRFTSKNSGTIARNFNIPGSFSLSFRVAWRNSPNIQIYFADDTLETTGKADRYYLQFGGSGLELKRQQSNAGHGFLTMTSIPGDPGTYPDNNLEVELRIDRKLGRIHLYLDGEYEGKFQDPVETLPTGQGVMFRSNIGGDDSQFIDKIEIREWDASSDRHRNEERGDEKQDVLITRGSDRSAGSILGLSSGGDGSTIRYQGPHHPEPVELPVSEVSTLFFARPAEAVAVPPATLFLELRGRGSLGVTACTFGEDSVAAVHPLLGELSIRREAVASLVRADKEDEESEPEEEEEE